MTTYYYPSNYGSARQVAHARAAGVRNFVGQGQAPAGSYTVVTPIAGTDPQKYTVTVDYTGPGTGYTSVATQTHWSDANHLQAFINVPGQGSAYLVLTNGPVSPKFHYLFPRKPVPFEFNAGSTTDPTVQSAATMVTCFASGTMIRTVAGDRAVEDLAVGDFAVVASGAARAIRWLGHRTIDCRRHPCPSLVLPIRIAAHAFGAGRPRAPTSISRPAIRSASTSPARC